MRTLTTTIVLHLFMLTLAPVASSAVVEVDTQWLETHQLTVASGDTVRVVGSAAQPRPAVENIQWLGGELRFVGCRLAPAAGRVPTGLPLVVSTGQSLLLENSWIEGAATALVLEGGSASLQQVTLASDSANIRCAHPSSQLHLQNVNLCNAAVGLQADSCDSILIQGALFLTNGSGLRVGAGVDVQLQDCLFQGNEWAIRLAAGATPPQFLGQVDLVDARYGLLENLSPAAVELGDTYVDDPSQLVGLWTRAGVNPSAPVHPLKAATTPTIDDDDFELNPLAGLSATIDGIPCKVSTFNIYVSTSPYSGFALYDHIPPNTPKLISLAGNHGYYRITACIGEWPVQGGE